MTNAEQIAASQKQDEIRLAKLGKAIEFLNHHVGSFGMRPYRDPDDSWKGKDEDRPDAIAELPESIRQPMIRACSRAAEWVEREFVLSSDPGPSLPCDAVDLESSVIMVEQRRTTKPKAIP